jgi:hypothetical protein
MVYRYITAREVFSKNVKTMSSDFKDLYRVLYITPVELFHRRYAANKLFLYANTITVQKVNHSSEFLKTLKISEGHEQRSHN